MEQPYLIQRAKFDDRGTILSFDYMGSAEFEFGALPKSLKRVRDNIHDYVMFQYSFTTQPSKVVTVFCKKTDRHFIPEILEQLSKDKIRLKEYCDLHSWVNPDSYSKNYNDFWWDISQDWFFWKFTPDFDLKFKTAIQTKPE